MIDKFMRVNRTGGIRPKFNSHGHGVLCLLVSVALHLCGCASSRSTVSTKSVGADAPSVRKVDYRRTPEVNELAERARQLGDEMYPKVLALLADDTAKLPRQFDIVFRKRTWRG